MVKWIFNSIKPSSIKNAVKKIFTNSYMDKTTEHYMEVRKIAMITRTIHNEIAKMLSSKTADYAIAKHIKGVFYEYKITESEVSDIILAKTIGLRMLDHRLIKDFGSKSLNLLSRKNKDFLLELAIMENSLDGV